MRSLLCMYLKKFGIANDSASNGREAFELFQNTRYDLVFMDLRMPKMDGYEATRAIRKFEVDAARSAVPIIAVSSEPNAHECLAAGMVDYYCKPLLEDQLKEVLLKWT